MSESVSVYRPNHHGHYYVHDWQGMDSPTLSPNPEPPLAEDYCVTESNLDPDLDPNPDPDPSEDSVYSPS